MNDLSRTQDHPNVAPRRQWVDDLNELYCQTKAAQAQAERHGFAGMAAALAEVAAGLTREPGVDRLVVWAFEDRSPSHRMGTSAVSHPHGGNLTWH